jgi:hypothetical protein
MNRNSIRLLLFSTILMSSSLMCSLFSPTNNYSPMEKKSTVDSLQLTVSYIEMKAATPTFEPTSNVSLPTMVKPPTGSISGTFSFLSESIPPLRIVAVKIDTGEFFATEVMDPTMYKLDGLPLGKYHVLAYPVDTAGTDANLKGGYSKFVTCGQKADCTDHNLVDVIISDETEVTNIDIKDWYAPAGVFPADPTK